MDGSPAVLIERADAAMYADKRSNREARLAAASSPCVTVRGRTAMGRA